MKCLPNDPGFAAEMSGHINRVIKLLGGRTMCLFTSWKNLEACAEAADYVHGALRHAMRPGRTKLAVLDHFWLLRGAD